MNISEEALFKFFLTEEQAELPFSTHSDTDWQARAAKTAISRKRGGQQIASMPAKWLTQKGFVEGDVLYHGRGRDYGGEELLADAGTSIAAYDPTYANHPENLNRTYDTVVSIYVLNTLSPNFRSGALEDIAKTTGGNAYVAVRSTKDSGLQRIAQTAEAYEDGFITSKGTFQKAYTPEDLAEELGRYFKDVDIVYSSGGTVIARASH